MPEARIGLFARTFLLLALLMLASLGAWLHVFFTLETEPRAVRVSQEIERTLTLTKASLQLAQAGSEPDQVQALAKQAGFELVVAQSADVAQPIDATPYWRAVTAQLKTRYGDAIELSSEVNGKTALWIQFPAQGRLFWLGLPLERDSVTTGAEWVSWVAAAALLSLVGAAVAVGYLNRPLARLARAARGVSRGQTPPPLPEAGAHEIRELNASFNRMVVELQQADTDRRLMLAGISHDLRTPLARMRLEVEMSAMSDEQRRAIDQDLSQIDRTIGQLVEYARPAGELPQRPINLLDVVQAVCDLEGDRLNALGGCLTVKAKATAYALIDRHDFSRCLINLLENAQRYGVLPGQAPQLEISLHTSADRVYVDVCDRGPGIPVAEVARLLRPFSRGEDARTGGAGAGLGLSIVERLLARASGKLRLLPRVGGGLTARIDLPRNRRTQRTRSNDPTQPDSRVLRHQAPEAHNDRGVR